MRDILDKEEGDNGSNAASLTRIKVRKPKADLLGQEPSRKIGDITDRLAALATELDNFDTTPIEKREKTLPEPPRPTNTGWSKGTPDRRKASADRAVAAANGWGKKPATHGDILSYWMEIREGGRRYPSHQSLDPNVIGKNWPNCILVHCNRDIGRLQVKFDFTHAIRQAAYGELSEEEILGRIEFTPMIVDWILSVGQTVSSTRKPAHTTEFFPTLTGECPLRVIALPLSESGRDIDHVLCYIQKLQ
ncbi:hypothetical protein [Sneathiella sp.]|jgi:hypothetical protein|uniref:hypothetical protein n=1 Tax=Sneathiella sp. TaxID=1964365 RepID=UPI0039E47071